MKFRTGGKVRKRLTGAERVQIPYRRQSPDGKEIMNQNIRTERLKYAVKIAMLAAMADVLMLFEFPLPFLALPFYKLDVSELPVLLGGFALGPVAGVLIELLKNLLHLLLPGSSTMGVGELANFVTGCVLILPAAVFYRIKKQRSSAVVGLSVGVLIYALAGALMNYFILIPFYCAAFSIPEETLVTMGQDIIPAIHDLSGLVALSVTPFNLVKGILCAVLTLLVYKPLSPILHK